MKPINLKVSVDLVDWLGNQLEGLEIPTYGRRHIAAACYKVGLLHHDAMILLLAQGRTTSALALLRPLVEAYLRGAWIQFYASEDQVGAFLKGKELKASQAVQDLETCEAFDQGRLTEIKKAVWSDLCDLTHCGGETISSQFSGDDLTPNFSEEYLHRAMASADAWALMIANSMALLGNHFTLALQFIERAKNLKRDEAA